MSLTVEVLCLQLANRLVAALVQIAMALCKLNAHIVLTAVAVKTQSIVDCSMSKTYAVVY